MYTDTLMLNAILLFLLILSVLSWTVLGVKVWLLAREHKVPQALRCSVGNRGDGQPCNPHRLN